MHGSELLAPLIVAERQREASRTRLARLAAKGQGKKHHSDRTDPTQVEIEDAGYLPRLRGYPVDPFFAHNHDVRGNG